MCVFAVWSRAAWASAAPFSAGVQASASQTQPPPGAATAGGPAQACRTQIKFGVIAALGCLQKAVRPTQIPAAERKALCSRLKLNTKACEKQLKQDIKKPSSDPRIARTTVRVNGLDTKPSRGAVILLYPRTKLVLSARAAVQILGGRVTLYSGRLQLAGAKPGDVPFLDANLDQLARRSPLAAAALKLGGFKLTGTLGVKLARYQTKLSAAVSLPTIFTSVGIGGALTAQATATADNGADIQFNELYFKGPTVNFGGFRLQNVALCYQNHISNMFCQSKTGVNFGSANPAAPSWNVTAKVSVLGVTLNAAPPPPTYGIAFVNGQFAFGGAQATFPPPGLAIGGTSVFLTGLGGSFGLNPIRITGTVGLTAGALVKINGSLFLVVPVNGQQYTFTGNELGDVIMPPLALPNITVHNFALAAGGSVTVNVPEIGDVNLADGYALYAYPSYVAAGGGVNLDLLSGKLAIDGGVQGRFNFGTSQFDIEGQIDLTAPDLPYVGDLTIGASGVVSSTGIAACGEFDTGLPLVGKITVGAGYKWNTGLSGFKVMAPVWPFDPCTLTDYKVAVSASSAQTALTGYSLRVSGGRPSEVVKLIGWKAAPDVRVSGPGGVHASTAGRTGARQGPFIILRDFRHHTTYIAIHHPHAGGYRIITNRGSTPITRVLTAYGFNPWVHARVAGADRQRRLHYSFNAQPGETVTFVERGQGVEHAIGTAHGSHGTLGFRPAPGPGGIRQIIATASIHGVPVVFRPGTRTGGQLVVGTYRAPGPWQLAAVQGLRAYRAGSTAVVSFNRVPKATWYVVLITLQNGMRTDYVVTGNTLRVSAPRVGPLRGRVFVRALGDGLATVSGATASTTLAPT